MASTEVVKSSEFWTGGKRRTFSSSHSTGTPSSLVFDMDDEEDQSSRLRSKPHQCDHYALSQRLSYFTTPQGAFAQQLLKDVRTYKAILHREVGRVDADMLASKLAGMGYHVCVRTALSSGGTACFKNLRHKFLVIRGADESERHDCLVEPEFRDHFEIPHPSPTYLQILKLIPEEFVGPMSSLSYVVQAVCAEMAVSFAAQGLTLPPWRRADSVLSKWMPARSKDVSPGESRKASVLDYSTQFVSREQYTAGKAKSQLFANLDLQRKISSKMMVRVPSVPGLLPVYSVQCGFAPRVAC